MKKHKHKRTHRKPTKSLLKRLRSQADDQQTLDFKEDGRLIHSEKLQVLQWLAEYKSITTIVGLIEQQFHKKLDRKSVWRYTRCKKWAPLIAYLKKKVKDNLAARIPIANKAVQLKALQKVMEEGLTWNLKSETKKGIPIYELNLGSVVAAVREASELMNGKRAGSQIHIEKKTIFQDITINIEKTNELARDINNRLAAQFK